MRTGHGGPDSSSSNHRGVATANVVRLAHCRSLAFGGLDGFAVRESVAGCGFLGVKWAQLSPQVDVAAINAGTPSRLIERRAG